MSFPVALTNAWNSVQRAATAVNLSTLTSLVKSVNLAGAKQLAMSHQFLSAGSALASAGSLTSLGAALFLRVGTRIQEANTEFEQTEAAYNSIGSLEVDLTSNESGFMAAPRTEEGAYTLQAEATLSDIQNTLNAMEQNEYAVLQPVVIADPDGTALEPICNSLDALQSLVTSKKEVHDQILSQVHQNVRTTVIRLQRQIMTAKHLTPSQSRRKSALSAFLIDHINGAEGIVPLAELDASETRVRIGAIQERLLAEMTQLEPKDVNVSTKIATNAVNRTKRMRSTCLHDQQRVVMEIKAWRDSAKAKIDSLPPETTDPNTGATDRQNRNRRLIEAVEAACIDNDRIEKATLLELQQYVDTLQDAIQTFNSKFAPLTQGGVGLMDWWHSDDHKLKGPDGINVRAGVNNLVAYEKACRQALATLRGETQGLRNSLRREGANAEELAGFSTIRVPALPTGRFQKHTYDSFLDELDAAYSRYRQAAHQTRRTMSQRGGLGNLIGYRNGSDLHTAMAGGLSDAISAETQAGLTQRVAVNEGGLVRAGSGAYQIEADPNGGRLVAQLGQQIEAGRVAMDTRAEAAEAALASLQTKKSVFILAPAVLAALGLTVGAALQYRTQLQALALRSWQRLRG